MHLKVNRINIDIDRKVTKDSFSNVIIVLSVYRMSPIRYFHKWKLTHLFHNYKNYINQ